MSTNSTASKLDRLIGLESAKRIVSSFVASKSETHALLFYGPGGSGKDELSRLMASYWLCTSPTQEGADGTCRSCNAFERGMNSDLLILAPAGAGNLITIKQFEERPGTEEAIVPLQRFLRTGPLSSRNKVVIISEAERMTEGASNNLLKTLEEPPHYAKLILTTSSTGGIRPTILSRVLAVACSLPTKAQIHQAFPAASAEEILIAESAPGRLAKILAHPNPYRDLWKFAQGLLSRRRGEALVASEELRSIAEKLDGALQCGARAANAEAVRILCLIFARDPAFPSSWAQAGIVAHERIVANVNAGLVMDALFANTLP